MPADSFYSECFPYLHTGSDSLPKGAGTGDRKCTTEIPKSYNARTCRHKIITLYHYAMHKVVSKRISANGLSPVPISLFAQSRQSRPFILRHCQ